MTTQKGILHTVSKTWNNFDKILLFILLIHIFLRTYQLDMRNPFGWDQVNNAWAAKGIIIDNNLPLLGMVAKNNSGIYIGPLYYYMITPFYFLTNLDPIASGFFAVFTSIISALILFGVAKKLFNKNVTYIILGINAVSFSGIDFDRVQWPVGLIPACSMLIFYFLYKVISDNPKYIIPLAILIGFSMHLHFTSVFYPIIVLFTLPFFPKSLKTVYYSIYGILIFTLFLLPNILFELQHRNRGTGNMFQYLNTYFHGVHLRRIMQLTKDAFIQFEALLFFPFLKFLKYIILPLFSFLYIFKKPQRERFYLVYLLWLWFLVPWIVFSVYSGEISDYYFSINRYLVYISVGYILSLLLHRNIFIKSAVAILLLLFIFVNIKRSFEINVVGLRYHKKSVIDAIELKKVIPFKEGDPQAYIYYVLTRNKEKTGK